MASVPPSVRRQRVGAELKRLRTEKGWSVREAAAGLEGFSASKISRIESGKGNIQGDDVFTLCAHYGASRETAEELVKATRHARSGTWWHEYGPDVVGAFADFIELELDAQSVREFEADVVPGQLQTREVAAAILRLGQPGLPEEVLNSRVDLRMERQRRRPPQMWAILDEAALLRPIGGSLVMADQLRHLAEQAQTPGLNIQILPLDAPGHAALGTPFTLLTVSDGTEYAYLDGLTGGYWTEAAGEVSVYRETWSLLSATAAPFDRSLAMIKQAEAKHRSAWDVQRGTSP
jgi:transcriptional regulator with XRE-family HTH domain